MLCWGGFSGRALATRQSCLFRMQEGAAALDASVSFSENTASGVAPAFQDEGFARPATVPLITNGRHRRLAGQPANREGVRASHQRRQCIGDARNRSIWRVASLAATDALAALDTGLYVGNLWYLNFSDRPACRMTGHDAIRLVLGRAWADRRACQRHALRRQRLPAVRRAPGRPDVGEELSSATTATAQRNVSSMRAAGRRGHATWRLRCRRRRR